MCLSQPKPPPPPPTPPPPPPVLEQDAPKIGAPKTGERLTSQATGTKKYRNPLGISGAGSGVGNSNLGISQ